MPRTQLPITKGYYKTGSKPVSSQSCINLYPVIERRRALVRETLRTIPGVTLIVADENVPLFDPLGPPDVDSPADPSGPTPPDPDARPDIPDAPLPDLDEDSGAPPDGSVPVLPPRDPSDPACMPYACDALGSDGWDYFIYEAEPAFDDIFPIAGVEPIDIEGDVTDFNSQVLLREPIFLNEVFNPCEIDPAYVLTVRQSGTLRATNPGARVVTAIIAAPTAGVFAGLFHQVQISGNLTNFNSSFTETLRAGVLTDGGELFAQAGGSPNTYEWVGSGDQRFTDSKPNALDMTDTDGIDWIFTRLEWEYLGQVRFNPTVSPTIQYIGIDVRVLYQAYNVNGDIVEIDDVLRVAIGVDTAGVRNVENVEFEFNAMWGASLREYHVAALKIGEAADYGKFADDYLAWLRNREDYTPPAECP